MNTCHVSTAASLVSFHKTHPAEFCATFVATGVSSEHLDQAEQLLQSSEATNANVRTTGEGSYQK